MEEKKFWKEYNSLVENAGESLIAGEYDKVIEITEKILDLEDLWLYSEKEGVRPGTPYYWRSQAETELGLYHRALLDMQKAVEYDPNYLDSVGPHYIFGKTNYYLNDFKACIHHLNRMFEISEGDEVYCLLDAYSLIARSNYELGNYDANISLLPKAIELFPERIDYLTDYYYYLGLAYFLKGDYVNSCNKYLLGLKYSKEDIDLQTLHIRLGLSNSYLKMRRFFSASYHLLRAWQLRELANEAEMNILSTNFKYILHSFFPTHR